MQYLPHGLSKSQIASLNKRSVLREIVRNRGISRTQISSNLNLTQTTISRICKALIEDGILAETVSANGKSVENGGRGRNAIGLAINSDKGYVVGIAINAFSQSVTLTDLANQVLVHRRISLPDLANKDAVLANVIELTKGIIRQSNLDHEKIIGSGIVMTGKIEPEYGLIQAPKYLGWRDAALKEIFINALKLPVHIENIPNAKMLAETEFGDCKTCRHAILLNVSLSIGVSFYINHQIYRGHQNAIGLLEDWQLPKILNADISLCEQSAGFAVVNEARKRNLIQQSSDPESLMQCISQSQSGSKALDEVFAQVGASAKYVVDSLIAIFHPEKIIISGPVAQVPAYMAAIRAPRAECNTKIFASTVSAHRAATLMALNEFLINRSYTP